jgi:hypothetical protein
MKRIPNYILIFLFLCSLLMSACSKSFLTKTPADALPVDQALSDSSALQTALYGAYSELKAVDCYGRSLPILGDLQADNTYVEIRNAGRYLNNYSNTVAVNDAVALGIWQDLYAVIERANAIIDAKPTGLLADQVKSQAYALRGLSYFKLVNLFAKPYTDDKTGLGVPLVLHYDLTYLPKRSPIDSVYTQIVSDFKAALPHAPAYTASTSLSYYSIEALLARAYLYMGDNTNAEATAVDVINNSGFSLVDPAHFAGFWANAGIQSDGVEVMFEVDVDIHSYNGSDDLSLIYTPDGYQDIYASSQLYNLYSPTDVRRSLIIPGTTKLTIPAYLVNKFANGGNQADKDNLKVIRLAEVYLIAAEAALPGDEATALSYLNALVAQRDPAFTGYASTGAQLLSDIVTERRKELAFEGDRLSDLNRLKLPINRVANQGAIAGPLTIPYPDNGRVQPIPQSEVQVNPNIAGQQNPGYN